MVKQAIIYGHNGPYLEKLTELPVSDNNEAVRVSQARSMANVWKEIIHDCHNTEKFTDVQVYCEFQLLAEVKLEN